MVRYTEKMRVGKPRTASVNAPTQARRKERKKRRGFIYKATVIRRAG